MTVSSFIKYFHLINFINRPLARIIPKGFNTNNSNILFLITRCKSSDDESMFYDVVSLLRKIFPVPFVFVYYLYIRLPVF